MTPVASDAAAPRVSVVCPFFNEEGVIVEATQTMMATLERDFGVDWELILVNDGSTDASLDRLLDLAARTRHPQLRVLSFPYNQGRGRAIKAGIDAARGDIVVTTEVDGSWGEAIVRQLVDELASHPECDFVIASPHRQGGGLKNVPPGRVLLTTLGNRLIRVFFGSGVTMNTGMTRAYRRGVIQPLVVYANGKEFHLEVLLKLITIGFRFREIPATITWNRFQTASDARRSSTNIGRTMASHLQFLAIARPVRSFVALAAVTGVVSMAFLAAAIVMLITRLAPAIFLALTGLSLLLVALAFSGFAVTFSEMRDAMRAELIRPYPPPYPPSARSASQVYPSPGER